MIVTQEEAIQAGLELVNHSQTAMLSTIGDEGYPHIRAMLKKETEGLKTFWFSTNASSSKVPQIQKNPEACVYFVDGEQCTGLMLVGEIDVLQDMASKRRLWYEGDEQYYPLGVNDPDYCVLCFRAKSGKFYRSLQNVAFDLEDEG